MDKTNLPLSRLSRAADHPVAVTPTPDARKAIAAELRLLALRKLRLEGVLVPQGKADWRLDARLGATVVQPCVVTLDPVTTRIDTRFTRHYRADLPEPDADEMEMPEDDSTEPLPADLDLEDVLFEALALALPDYPRTDGAVLGEAFHAAPGIAPMKDEDARPLAALSGLRDRLEKGAGDDENEG